MQSRPEPHQGLIRFARRGTVALGAALAMTMGVIAVPALGQKPALAMLDRLEPGRWELASRDGSRNRERICLRDARRLLQLQHAAGRCEQLVVDDSTTEVTVQYSCKGQGYGRTTIRRETNRLVQIESQGIADGLPFEFSAEGRYLGPCSN